MILTFAPDGIGRCVYSEDLDLSAIGSLAPKRASTVEFNVTTQQWEVRLCSEPDRVAFSHTSRAECIRWEIATLNSQLVSL